MLYNYNGTRLFLRYSPIFTTKLLYKVSSVCRKAGKTPNRQDGVCETPPVSSSVGAYPEADKVETFTIPSATPASMTSLTQQYFMMSKIRLTGLVVLTAMSGYAMAPGPLNLSTIVLCSLGTGLLSAGANAINQFHEVPFDAQMSRTRNRLLVRSVLTPLHAVSFAMTSATMGGLILYFGVNSLTAGLGVVNLVLYTSVYTPMKRVSIVNTWLGAVVGALPPLMGWSGCTGGLEPGAWVMAGILYAWQFPHFNALSWNLRQDYSRAGYRMMAVTDPDLCRRTTLRYTLAIDLLCLASPAVNLTNSWFVLESLPLNASFTYLAWKFYKESDSSNSRKLFRFSLVHLPALMLLMLFNKEKPKDSEEAVEEKK